MKPLRVCVGELRSALLKITRTLLCVCHLKCKKLGFPKNESPEISTFQNYLLEGHRTDSDDLSM